MPSLQTMSFKISRWIASLSLIFATHAWALDCWDLESTAPGKTQKISQKKKAVVVISPFSSGSQAPEVFTRFGFEVITAADHAELSAKQIQGFKAFPHHLNLTNIKSLSERADAIAKYAAARGLDIVAVIPGAEHGTKLSMDLSVQLKNRWFPDMHANQFRDHFIDKEAWIRHLKKQGLSDFPSFSINSVKALEQLAAREGFFQNDKWSSVILKSPDSSGGNQVESHTSLESLIASADKFFKTPNKYGHRNQKLLVQLDLGKDEAFIDGLVFTYKGKTHVFITEIVDYDKYKDPVKKLNSYDASKFLSEKDELSKVLTEFASKALASADASFAFFHIEVFPKKVNGKYDIKSIYSTDAAFRPVGAGYPAIAEFTQGESQFTLLAKLLSDPEKYLKELPREYSLKKPNYSWIGYSFVEGARLNPDLYSELARVKDKVEREGGSIRWELDAAPGDPLPQGGELATKFGVVAVTHPDDAVAASLVYWVKNNTQWFAEGTGSHIPLGMENRRGKWEVEP